MRIVILLLVLVAGVAVLMGMTVLGIVGVLTNFVSQFLWPLAALVAIGLGWRLWRWWKARERQKQQQLQGMPSGITFYMPITNTNNNSNSNNVGR